MKLMKTNTKISLILLLLVIAGLTACIKEEQYPIIPHIEFKGFGTLKDISHKDSLGQILISFTDGDGNIGLYESDSVEPYKYNYYLKFMQYHNKQLVEVTPANPALTFNSRIPILTPNGRNKNITGDIYMTLELYFARQILLTDTIGFEIYILDRDLNKSNVLNTPLFIINK
jgi:hypothetical protein